MNHIFNWGSWAGYSGKAKEPLKALEKKRCGVCLNGDVPADQFLMHKVDNCVHELGCRDCYTAWQKRQSQAVPRCFQCNLPAKDIFSYAPQAAAKAPEKTFLSWWFYETSPHRAGVIFAAIQLSACVALIPIAPNLGRATRWASAITVIANAMLEVTARLAATGDGVPPSAYRLVMNKAVLTQIFLVSGMLCGVLIAIQLPHISLAAALALSFFPTYISGCMAQIVYDQLLCKEAKA